MKILCGMLVKNEEHRYLKEVLEFYKPIVDKFVIVDNMSTDKTVQLCEDTLKDKYDINTCDIPFETEETALRKYLFDEIKFYVADGDWIITPDADEVFESKFKHEVVNMMNVPDVYHYSFQFLHMWGCRYKYRVDGYWSPEKGGYGCRMYKYVEGYNYKWTSQSTACGAMPMNVLEQKGINSNIKIKHFGYADPESIKRKYEYYANSEVGKNHASSHINSIIDENSTLVEYKE